MTTTMPTISPLTALANLGTSIWLDSIRRSLVEGGELVRLVREEHVTGITANPAIFEKAILGSPDYDERLAQLTRDGLGVDAIYDNLALEDVRGAADVLRPVYESTEGRDGFASLEVGPELAHDEQATVAAVREFWTRLDRPNVMIKIPGTDEGAAAIRYSIAAGINVNVTLLFSISAYERVAEAYLAGLEERVARGESVDRIASVASFFVSRVDTMVDSRLTELGREDLEGCAAVANARLAYARFQEIVASEQWRRLREHGARPQRLLWASTATKNPRYSDVKYVEELAGPQVVNTMPMTTLLAFKDHGRVEDRLTGTLFDALDQIAEIERAGVSMAEVTAKLLADGIDAFDTSMAKLRAGIDRRRTAVIATTPATIAARLGEDDGRAAAGTEPDDRDDEDPEARES
jgi:transaldolase